MMHCITYLLETNNYVRCLMVDFSKAFDTVNHIVLIRKLCSLGLPANILIGLFPFSQGEPSTARLMVYILQQEALTYRLYRDQELAHVSISLWRVI